MRVSVRESTTLSLPLSLIPSMCMLGPFRDDNSTKVSTLHGRSALKSLHSTVAVHHKPTSALKGVMLGRGLPGNRVTLTSFGSHM